MKTHVALSPPVWRRLPWSGLSAGLVWLLAAGSAVHWGLRLWVPGRDVPLQAQTVGVDQALQGDPARLFARAAPVAAPAASPARDRFRVLGVAAADGAGWAVMSVDGKPPRAYRQGAAVDGQWVVLAIGQRRIDVGPSGGPPAVALDLQGLPDASTGKLPGLSEPGLVQQVPPPLPQQPMPAPGPPGNEGDVSAR